MSTLHFGPVCVCAKLLQGCPTLCNPMNHDPPGSSLYGLLQARILEWVVMASSRGSSRHRDQSQASYLTVLAGDSLPPVPPSSSHIGSGMRFLVAFTLTYNLAGNCSYPTVSPENALQGLESWPSMWILLVSYFRHIPPESPCFLPAIWTFKNSHRDNRSLKIPPASSELCFLWTLFSGFQFAW